ncbi:hypothetical protein D6851_16795 [Altericroceibacterium spongiae]|uniref:Uncharacterized protein n=1 Tax=Altericroceibacterium spongiae TaxID=2320269 RepID=A0A420E9B3_9SPHN|nr:hypothetical protein [Altericroceibacterium spongiae]ETI62699.1 hypothetical protein C100_16470 [Sphingobium sp. C100]RKF17363.1 hypothetical protein D6851_16795 [Altericroceibacterium spongiae]
MAATAAIGGTAIGNPGGAGTIAVVITATTIAMSERSAESAGTSGGIAMNGIADTATKVTLAVRMGFGLRHS